MKANQPENSGPLDDAAAITPLARLQAAIADAFTFLNMGAPQEAIAHIRQYADLAAANNVGSYIFGLIYFNADDPRNALGWFERALVLDPHYTEALTARAIVLQRLGQPQDALGAFEAILRLRPDDVDAMFNIGVTLQSLGRMSDALTAYENALRARPDHVEALTNRGILLERFQRFDEALACFVAIEPLRPDDSRNMVNKASVLQRLGRHEDALAAYEAAGRCGPQDTEIELSRGNVLRLLGRLEEAVECFDRASLYGQGNAQALFNKGATLQSLGRTAAALEAYDAALAIDPDFCEALCNRGNALHQLGRLPDALESYAQSLKVRPGFVPALINRATIFLRWGHFQDAVLACADALRNDPENPQALGIRGAALHKLGCLDEALDELDHALRRDPNMAEAWLNRGNVLQERDQQVEAVASYHEALRLRPQYPEALSGQGVALKDLGRVDEALACFDEALKHRPAYPDARNNRAGTLLLKGMLKAGFDDFESRWDRSNAPPKTFVSSLPAWDGGDLKGKAIIVWDEQGLGDLIQFSRYIPCLVDLGADVTVLCRKNMHRLLRSLPNEVRLVDAVDADARYAVQCALMSLPRAFQTTLDTIPHQVPYLRAEPDLITRWVERIGSDGFRIGICRQGNAFTNLQRSVPLSSFAPLAAIEGVRLIGLETNQGRIEVEAAGRSFAIESLGSDFDAGPHSFIDCAAVMATLDLVVTSDTSIAHLAGALGRPVFVALKHVADWRWLIDRDDSPWYPTMRLFRQTERGEWDSVLQRIAAWVEPLAAARSVMRRQGQTATQIRVPVSIGELIDKITILEIKASHIEEPVKLANVRHELALLREVRLEAGLGNPRLSDLEAELETANARLWQLEDALRLHEARMEFDAEFVALARQVYKSNDKRAELKRKINLLFHSAIIEEKSYSSSDRGRGP